MERREFITLLGATTATWPLGARAQQLERIRRVGVLMGIANDSDANARAVALQEGLRVLGWISDAISKSTIASQVVMLSECAPTRKN
jgi:putative ABC transport system substrate-binding protein